MLYSNSQTQLFAVGLLPSACHGNIPSENQRFDEGRCGINVYPSIRRGRVTCVWSILKLTLTLHTPPDTNMCSNMYRAHSHASVPAFVRRKSPPDGLFILRGRTDISIRVLYPIAQNQRWLVDSPSACGIISKGQWWRFDNVHLSVFRSPFSVFCSEGPRWGSVRVMIDG